MKDSYPGLSLSRICRLLGITRQAFYQHFWYMSDVSIEQQLVLQRVKAIRSMHPAIGARKLYLLLHPFLLDHQIKIGRDGLFDLLSENKLLVRKRKRRVNTTQSHHWLKKYPNLTKTWHPQKPNQLWVADITYVPITNGFLYLSLITDAYSHKIMGYNIAGNLEAVHTAKALQMALKNKPTTNNQLIHHSDRGIQYCCGEYVSLLKQNAVQISMTENGDPLENPIAERVNGIIKQEYLSHYQIYSQYQAAPLLETIIKTYNEQRPHQSINMLTPEVVHQKQLLVNKRWGMKKQITTIVNSYQD